MSDFLKAVNERVVVYDGAMGTNIQFRNLTADDYWGKEGCNELLVLSRPDVIADIHAAFFSVGCDIVESNTFGSTRIVLAEYGLEDRTRELNLAACKVAREVANQFSTPGRPRFVAGSIGPTTKLPSLGHITWDAMLAALCGAGRGADRRRRGRAADGDLPGHSAGQVCRSCLFRCDAEGGTAASGAGAGDAGGDRHDAAWDGDRRGADGLGSASMWMPSGSTAPPDRWR